MLVPEITVFIYMLVQLITLFAYFVIGGLFIHMIAWPLRFFYSKVKVLK